MRRYLLLLAALYSSACGTTLDFIPTARPPHKLFVRDPASVELHMSGRPNRPYIEVGMIESQQENMSLDDPHEVIDKMRTFAGQLGCDALVIFAGNDATVVSGGSNSTISQTLKGYRGSCLVYTAQPLQHRPNPVLARPTTCMPNATQLCYGPGGCRGAQRCAEDGKSFTLCDCGPAHQPAAVSATTSQ